MAFVNYGVPQVQNLSNLAAAGSTSGGGGITTVPNYDASGNYPITSGLSSVITGGTTLYLNNTVQTRNDVVTTPTAANTFSVLDMARYINVTSRRTTAAGCAFSYTLPNSSTTYPKSGQWMSIHIDNTCLTTDTFYILYYGYNAAGTAGNQSQTATIGSTYTFMCFTDGIWYKM